MKQSTHKHRRSHWLFIAVLLVLIEAPVLRSQSTRMFTPRRKIQGRLVYKTFAMPTMNPDTLSLYVYVKVSNDLLQFVLDDSLYQADYELTVVIRDEDGEAVASDIRRQEVSTPSYMETNDKFAFTKSRMEFPISPGKYRFFIELTDAETDQPITVEEELTAPRFFDESFKTTDLLFFHASKEEDFTDNLPFPEIPPIHTASDSSFTAEMFICTDGSHDTLRITQTILSRENEPLFENVVVDIPILGRIQPVKFNLDKDYRFGQYLLAVSVTDGESTKEVKSPFYVRWKSHMALLPSLAQTVETLQHIMSGDEWKELKALPIEEQETFIEQFWKERDPDPSTEVNELEEEYYSRVAFANQNFAAWQGDTEGWRTDRGRIYVIYGAPTDVERPITTSGNRLYYEIWYYSHLQKRYVFRDRYGTGEYRLIAEEY